MEIMKFVLLGWVLVFLTACSTLSPKKTNSEGILDVYVFADNDINQNLLGEPSPVKLSILQLISEVEFNQMNELSSSGSYKTHLGSSVLEETHIMVRPGQKLDFKLPMNDRADYLGVVVALRDVEKKWKFSLYKQHLRWYQRGGEFLYLEVKDEGVVQLSKSEALDKLLEKKLAEEKVNLDEMTEKQKLKLKDGIEKMMDEKKPADLKKGIYIQSEPNL
ncbi:type VI secretion system lipoprotein TssJ [Acinetobacter rudis]|uniref:type VI secretion system lipoprotein TssJ n=1 Tax=Acinetobacter rudis TaxID=632955 RepID=UPI00333E7064